MPTKQKKKRERISLLNGCYCTPIKVIPANWNEPGADFSREWRAYYRFYDPSQKDHPKYKGGVRLISMKGMNDAANITLKRRMTEELIATEKDHLIKQCYNPITGKYMTEVSDMSVPELSPNTPFIQALNKALIEKKCVPSTRADIKSVLKYVTIASKTLKYCDIPIRDIKRGHIKTIFKQLSTIKKSAWSENNQNHYRSHLSMLFTELEEWEAIEYNPINKISKVEEVKKKPKQKVLNEDERTIVDRTLRQNNYPFWRFVMIFFMAGCRRTEIMRVQAKDVDLVQQKFTALRKKGVRYTEVEYTITNAALYLWRELLDGCKPDDYIFSRGLVPGPDAIRFEQVTRRWRRWVKDKFDIDANFYSLKHLQSTMTANELGTAVAAKFNNESEKMISKHYDVDEDKRKHEQMKKINHQFVVVKGKHEDS